MTQRGPVPEPYLSPMDEASISLYEMYRSLLRAGFNRRDALTVITNIVSQIVQSAQESEEDGSDG